MVSFRKLPCAPKASDWFTPAVDQSVSDIFANGNWNMSNPSPSCQCSTPKRTVMLPDCPAGAGGLPPPRVSPVIEVVYDCRVLWLSDQEMYPRSSLDVSPTISTLIPVSHFSCHHPTRGISTFNKGQPDRFTVFNLSSIIPCTFFKYLKNKSKVPSS